VTGSEQKTAGPGLSIPRGLQIGRDGLTRNGVGNHLLRSVPSRRRVYRHTRGRKCGRASARPSDPATVQFRRSGSRMRSGTRAVWSAGSRPVPRPPRRSIVEHRRFSVCDRFCLSAFHLAAQVISQAHDPQAKRSEAGHRRHEVWTIPIAHGARPLNGWGPLEPGSAQRGRDHRGA